MALLEFYGTECPHCNRMHPLIARLEKELGVEVKKYETWHDEKNAALMKKYDTGHCGGVPFFYNDATDKWICGEVSYEELKAWAEGKKS
ncbi:MAG: thioredoxin domain-containing protein [Patescibacteria group bacterium]